MDGLKGSSAAETFGASGSRSLSASTFSRSLRDTVIRASDSDSVSTTHARLRVDGFSGDG